MLKYPVTIMPDRDGDGFYMQVYDIPIVISRGKSREEALGKGLDAFIEQVVFGYFNESKHPALVPAPRSIESLTLEDIQPEDVVLENDVSLYLEYLEIPEEFERKIVEHNQASLKILAENEANKKIYKQNSIDNGISLRYPVMATPYEEDGKNYFDLKFTWLPDDFYYVYSVYPDENIEDVANSLLEMCLHEYQKNKKRFYVADPEMPESPGEIYFKVRDDLAWEIYNGPRKLDHWSSNKDSW